MGPNGVIYGKWSVSFDQTKPGSVDYRHGDAGSIGSYQCHGSEGTIDFLDVGLQMLSREAYNKDTETLLWKGKWYRKIK